jgi:6-pyruvoyltetrahydropterin/6-carboxytetrahydropterin synthase
MKGRFSIRIEARFESAHFLRTYRGTAEPLHGHSYRVEAVLSAAGNGVDEDAIAVDFVTSRAALERLAKKLDFACINEVEPFTTVNPSAENIAEWFWQEMSAAVEGEGAVVDLVTVWEGPFNAAIYEPDRHSRVR